MSDMISLVLKTTEGDYFTFNAVKQFSFRKDKYTPFTEMTITVADTGREIAPGAVIHQVNLMINRLSVHIGLADTCDCRMENGVSFITIRSRGYTSLLLNNQMVPGIHSQMSLEKLMTGYYEFPYPVQWEQDSTVCNYIFVREHRSMWDSVVNLGYKLYGKYPYIKGPNRIMLRPSTGAANKTFTEDEVMSIGVRTDTTGIISHLHMQDIEGNYGVYNLENANAEELLIVRHKQTAFDRQYLDDPVKSMQLTFSLASSGWRSRYITVKGYPALDVNDYISCGELINNERICAVSITGDRSGIRSTFSVYDDDFTEN